MEIQDKTVVTMHYTLTSDAGEVIDSSEGREPLAYLHGAQNIVPGLEKEMTGKKVGEKFTVAVPPADGYGEKSPEMIQAVPRENFGDIAEIQVGQQFQAATPQGPHIVTVVEVTDKEVTVDANHPLAGATLNFAIEVTEVREASEEEIAAGQVINTGGGCCSDGSGTC